MTTEKVVEEPVSEQEPVSEGETEQKETTEEEAFTDAQKKQMQTLIDEATTKAVTEAEAMGARKLQSAQDRNKADLDRADRRTSAAERIAADTGASLTGLEPDQRDKIELARLRAKDQETQRLAQEDSYRLQMEETYKSSIDDLKQHITDLGYDPNDKRLNWGNYGEPLLPLQKRIFTQIKEIHGEGTKSIAEQVKEAIAKERKEQGLDSVDTTSGGGGGSGSDADFKKGVGDGSIDITTKANYGRAKKLGLV